MRMQKASRIYRMIVTVLDLTTIASVMNKFTLPFTDLLVQQLLIVLGSAVFGGLGRSLALSYARE